MVPFYGQGMNAGLEDVRVLFSFLDKHDDPGSISQGRAAALAEYTAFRVPDAHAINDLALQNYIEMRSSVLSPAYRLRKILEESLSKYFPGLGWQTKYSRVSFGNERYSDVAVKSERQGRVLIRAFMTAVGLPILAGSILLIFKYKRTINAGLSSLSTWLLQLVQRR